MSAIEHNHIIFGSSWLSNNHIIMLNASQNLFQNIQIDQDVKINNWSSSIPINNEDFLISGGLGNTGKVISNEAFIFNSTNHQITQFPSFNQCRYVHQSIYHHNKIYLIGGRQYGPDFESVLSHCEKYEDGQWKIMPPMSKRRSNFAVFIYNDKIHAIGGFDGKKNTKSIEYYDEEKNVWLRLKCKMTRGLAGLHLIPKGPDKILIVGGMTLSGSSMSCVTLDLKQNTCISDSTMLQIRSLYHLAYDGNRYIAYGGMNKPNIFETYNETEHIWEECQISVEQGLQELFDSGLRGFSVTQKICVVDEQQQQIQQKQYQYQEELNPEDVTFLIGNDEYPFILPICKDGQSQLDGLEIPTQLGLFSYMSVCSVDAELPNCRQIFIAGGIDQKISSINKKAFLITIIFPEMKVKVKKIDKLSYHRYAAACTYLAPYIYVIGGRGYQNDILSLHNTVERFNIDDEEWDQISPLNEAKCSMVAQVVNDRIYVVGGYIGEGQMTHHIECYNEEQLCWDILNVELPFSLEGLSAIVIEEVDLLIIGGKGIEGSKKDIIRFHCNELEQNNNTSGQIIGQLQHSRSLPKPILLDGNKLLIIGGYFYDNPETNFGEIYNPLNPEDQDSEFANKIEGILQKLGGCEQINMFSVAE